MSRLHTELNRLYRPAPADGADTSAKDPPLIDAQGRVRALVLELAGPADWAAMAKVWNGVQADLALPAPAIAVAGDSGYQLWFALARAMSADEVRAFGQALAQHYLSDQVRRRLHIWPGVAAGSSQHACPVPAELADAGRWSAFVAADLAAMFADEPWLDLPPNPDGQAGLLSGLRCISPSQLEHALSVLRPTQSTKPAGMPAAQSLPPPEVGCAVAGQAVSINAHSDPRHFLLEVMNNQNLALGLRIEAAKALLQYPTSPAAG